MDWGRPIQFRPQHTGRTLETSKKTPCTKSGLAGGGGCTSCSRGEPSLLRTNDWSSQHSLGAGAWFDVLSNNFCHELWVRWFWQCAPSKSLDPCLLPLVRAQQWRWPVILTFAAKNAPSAQQSHTWLSKFIAANHLYNVYICRKLISTSQTNGKKNRTISKLNSYKQRSC